MSYGRRLSLLREVRDLGNRLEFLRSGGDARDSVELALAEREIQQIYLRWGLAAIDGLHIDGEPATPESLIANGPEELANEVLEHIQKTIGLSEDERKN